MGTRALRHIHSESHFANLNKKSKEFTTQTFNQTLTDKIGAGKCIRHIVFLKLVCNSDAWNQMWGVLLTRISDTGLKVLALILMPTSLTGGIVMPKLVSSPINSLTHLILGYNPHWWQSGEVFEQMLTFLKRQTHLKALRFFDNDLTTLQTTQLLQCIA